MPVNAIYHTTAIATGGRDGHARTLDGTLEVKLSVPKEMGGPGGPGNNPEQLFAAGYSACFLGAVKAVARKGGQTVSADATVSATIGFGPRSEGGFGITAELAISLPGMAHDEAVKLVEAAHQVCPYSNATRNNVDVKLSVV